MSNTCYTCSSYHWFAFDLCTCHTQLLLWGLINTVAEQFQLENLWIRWFFNQCYIFLMKWNEYKKTETIHQTMLHIQRNSSLCNLCVKIIINRKLPDDKERTSCAVEMAERAKIWAKRSRIRLSYASLAQQSSAQFILYFCSFSHLCRSSDSLLAKWSSFEVEKTKKVRIFTKYTFKLKATW